MRKYLAEFIGTFLLVAMGTGGIVYSSAATQSPLTIALVFGFALAIAIYTFGSISGGHFNPAVSLSMAIQKRLTWVDFGGYIVAQFLGAIVASGAVYVGVAAYLKSTTVTTALSGQTMTVSQFVSSVGLGQANYATGERISAFAFELILTFMFVLVVSIITHLSNIPGPLIIGLMLAILIIVALPITGGSFNPARSVAPAIFVGGKALKHLLIYIPAQLMAGALAALAANYFNKNSVTN